MIDIKKLVSEKYDSLGKPLPLALVVRDRIADALEADVEAQTATAKAKLDKKIAKLRLASESKIKASLSKQIDKLSLERFAKEMSAVMTAAPEKKSE